MSVESGLFDRVVLIYNPRNRRVPVTMAETVQADLGRRLPELPVTLTATQHAGHAEQLASSIAAVGRPLIVAVSGDGVYNEVINGALAVPGTQALTADVAAGNANDHRLSTRRMSLVEAVVASYATGQARHLDLLRCTVDGGASNPICEVAWSRYAHSYVGFGLTPWMAVGLKKDRKGTIAEFASVLRTFTELTQVQISRSGQTGPRHEAYDRLIFATVDRMAKYGRIGGSGHSGRSDDGLFEVVTVRHGRRWRIAAMALRAVTIGLRVRARVDRVVFTVVDSGPCQIDGEITQVSAGTQISIHCIPQALATVG